MREQQWLPRMRPGLQLACRTAPSLLALLVLISCSDDLPTVEFRPPTPPTEPVARELLVSPDSGAIEPHHQQRFTLSVTDGDGQPAPAYEIRWSSSDTAVAVVDSTGLATARRPGRAEIVVTVDGLTRTVILTVLPIFRDRPFAIEKLRGHGGPWSQDADWLPFFSAGYAISSSGVVVGEAERERPRYRVFTMWHDSVPIDLGIPPVCGSNPSHCVGTARAVNDRGEVVGRTGYHDQDSPRPWHYNDGVIRLLLPDSGEVNGVATAMNNRGDIAGFWNGVAGWPWDTPVLWRGDSIIDLGTLGWHQAQALGMNDSTWIVGWSRIALREDEYGPPPRHAFLWRDGEMQDLGTFGGAESMAHAINNRGQVVGWVGSHPYTLAFLWEGGTFHLLETTRYSRGRAINEHGVVVGDQFVLGVGTTAMVWRNGRGYLLNDIIQDASIDLIEATGINDSGEIVAIGRDRNDRQGVLNAYRLTPVRDDW
jgi:probable HAF family extracellular repeat protein